MSHTKIICLLVIVLTSFVSVETKDWNGLILLRSTCDDVKRILGVDKCEYPMSTYRLKGETVTVAFNNYPCATTPCCSKNKENDPPRVIEIIRQLHSPMRLSDFGVDETWEKRSDGDDVNTIIFDSRKEGLMLETFQAEVNTIIYYLSEKEKKERCTDVKNSCTRHFDFFYDQSPIWQLEKADSFSVHTWIEKAR